MEGLVAISLEIVQQKMSKTIFYAWMYYFYEIIETFYFMAKANWMKFHFETQTTPSRQGRLLSCVISLSASPLYIFSWFWIFFWTNKMANWDSSLHLSLSTDILLFISKNQHKNIVLTCPSHTKINSHFRKEALDMNSSFGRFPWKCQSQTMAVHTMLYSSEALKRTTISTNMNLSVTMPTWSPIDYRNDIVAHTMTTMRSGRAINVKFPTSYILKFSWLSIMMAIGCTMAIMFRLSDTLCRSGMESTCAIVYWRDRRFASASLASSFRGWVESLSLLPHAKCKVFRDICNTGSESRVE